MMHPSLEPLKGKLPPELLDSGLSREELHALVLEELEERQSRRGPNYGFIACAVFALIFWTAVVYFIVRVSGAS